MDIKKLEKVLSNYKLIKSQIKNIELEISESNKKETQRELILLKKHKENLILKIDNAIEALPDMKRRILELRYFSGLQFKQIAIRLSINETYCIQLKTKILKTIYPIIFIEE